MWGVTDLNFECLRQDTTNHLFVDLQHILHGLLNHTDIFVISFRPGIRPLWLDLKVISMHSWNFCHVLLPDLLCFGWYFRYLWALSSFAQYLKFLISLCNRDIQDLCVSTVSHGHLKRYTYMCTSCNYFFLDQV